MYGDWAFPISTNYCEPKSVKEALSSSEFKLWQKAIQDEIDSISDNNVWTLTDLPPDRKAIGCKWVFKRKTDSNGKCTYYLQS